MPSLRRTTAILISPILVMALASTVVAGAPSAHGTFVDANGHEVGWVKLTQDGRGDVHVNVHVKGLTPGLHGIHIHAAGFCTPTFAAAGGHFNPRAAQHGLDNLNGPHGGDLPNLVVNASGNGHLDGRTDRVTLTQGTATLFDGDGSAFIIHANEDDQSTDNGPMGPGNSGARIACAVIVSD